LNVVKNRDQEVEWETALIHNSSGLLEKTLGFNFGFNSPTRKLSLCTALMHRGLGNLVLSVRSRLGGTLTETELPDQRVKNRDQNAGLETSYTDYSWAPAEEIALFCVLYS
jgi:hypothetical protein